MAVGHNVLTVGSYNTRQEWLTLDGNSAHYEGDGFRPGYVSDFSSFGTLADGRNLPHVCAPGAAIVSSISNPYLTYLTDALAEQNGVTLTDETRRWPRVTPCSGAPANSTLSPASRRWCAVAA